MERVFCVEIPEEQQDFIKRKLSLMMKYDIGTSFSSSDNIDDKISRLSENEFKSITKQFASPKDFALATMHLIDSVCNAVDIEPSLWNRIQKTRLDYQKYIGTI